MDYVQDFDIKLVKEIYYAGEILAGNITFNTSENFKMRSIRVVLRGKAHVEWKCIMSGDRQTVKDDEYFVEDLTIIYAKDKKKGMVPILPRGSHQFPFKFQLPESGLPCSFESKPGCIRYYVKATVDIPYASPPQGIKYFTIIGPHIDCMNAEYLKPLSGLDKRTTCCLCCKRGFITLRTELERSAYVCGESLKLRVDIDNHGEETVTLKVKLLQNVEFFVDKTVLGRTKELHHVVLEYIGDMIKPNTVTVWDSNESLILPTMPPSVVGVCRIIQIYYVLKVALELEKSGEVLPMHFPITIATVPFRIPNSEEQPKITYVKASNHVEGGIYIAPEFLLGQVYDGSSNNQDSKDESIIYQPLYVTLAK